MSDRPTDPSQWPARTTPARPAHTPGHTPGHTPAEPDPTGVREILSSLRDPGPMPPDLIRRISASLSVEQARRERDSERHAAAGRVPSSHDGPLADGTQHDGPQHDRAQLNRPHTVSPRPDRPGSGTVHSFTAAQERRSGVRRRWPLVAAAASVAVLAGAVVMGVLGVLNGGLITTAAQDSASLASAGAGSRQGAAESDTQDEAGGADPGATEEGADAAAPFEDAATMMAAVPVLSTGAVLTRANLAEHVRTVRDREDWVPDAISEELASHSPINSVHGAVDCLTSALSRPPSGLAERIDAIDFVRYDGEPAGLILVLEEPDGPPQPLTAYLVPADCGRSTPRLLDDPLPLAS